MPKKIIDLRDKLLSYSRKTLLEGKAADLTIRSVASASGVAVGTVYNYFPSKENLIETVILVDFEVMIARLEKELIQMQDALEFLRVICEELQAFAKTYYEVLRIPPTRLDVSDSFRSRHNVFVDLLCELIQPAMVRCGCLFDPILPQFLAEALLVLAVDQDKHFENVYPIFRKLLK